MFHPEASLRHGPTSVPRMREANPDRLIFPDLPPLALGSGSTTPTSSPSWRRVRGPWDDSSCVEYVVDVDRVLALPKPVAMGV